ncbi:hypothetical protein DPMN_155674 [Dreissena polymorpha]|uniref:Uncharacterized protein n=1 Tax=Dreissena polymorpha TaxID=45954 RepID=A0A9D4JB50_DREPO|nr:hypothetical protein DPMN_155674 [Dreissena polymorpha]
MDFRVFSEVKSQLRGIRFASKQELTVAAKRIVSSFDADCVVEIKKASAAPRECVSTVVCYLKKYLIKSTVLSLVCEIATRKQGQL